MGDFDFLSGDGNTRESAFYFSEFHERERERNRPLEHFFAFCLLTASKSLHSSLWKCVYFNHVTNKFYEEVLVVQEASKKCNMHLGL
jgi:hypothetical protein